MTQNKVSFSIHSIFLKVFVLNVTLNYNYCYFHFYFAGRYLLQLRRRAFRHERLRLHPGTKGGFAWLGRHSN